VSSPPLSWTFTHDADGDDDGDDNNADGDGGDGYTIMFTSYTVINMIPFVLYLHMTMVVMDGDDGGDDEDYAVHSLRYRVHELYVQRLI